MNLSFERKFVATINGDAVELLINKKGERFITTNNNNCQTVEVLKMTANHCLLRIDNRVKAFYFEAGGESNTVTFNNKNASSQIDDHFIYAQKLKIGGDEGDSRAKQLLSPMPGLIVDVFFKAGDAVKKGEQLLILEAMKMENIIKAPNDACIKKIHVQKSQSVDKDQLIIEFES